MSDIIVRREIDLNTNLSSVDGCLPISIEKEKKVGVGVGSRIGFESNGVCMGKNSAEICNGGTTSAENQFQKDLVTTAMEADNKYDHTTGPPIESFARNHAVPAGSTDNMVDNDFLDHHSEKSTGLFRRRPRKVRLMTDLLSENGESKTEKISIQESTSHGISNTSAASQLHSIFPGKVDIQGDPTITNMGQSRKRKLLLDEVRRPASTCFQRTEVEGRNLDGSAKTTEIVFSNRSNSKGVLAETGLQVTERGNWSKPEFERSQIVGKKKNKKNQFVDNYLIPEPQQGQRRENKGTNTTDKAYASKTASSRLSSGVFTGKGMDNFPLHTLRIENEFNPSKEKGKMLQTDGELYSLNCQRNDIHLRDSFAYSGVKIRSSLPADVPIPSVQGMLNGKGLEEEEELHNALNYYLPDNTKYIHEMENRRPFSLPLQESTSRVPQFNRKNSETNVFGGPSIPSRHTTNTIPGKVHCEEITGTGKTVEQLGIMKRYNEQAAEVSEQGTLDDIPMEIVELLAKNQYERCLPDVENRCSSVEKSSISRKAQMSSGTGVNGKGKMSLLKEGGHKEKSHGSYKKNNMVTREENVNPSKRKPVHFSLFDESNSGVNNPCPPQPHFGYEVPQPQKKLSSGFQFSPMVSSQLGSVRNCKFNGNLEERASSNATLQAMGGCSLHKNILHQDSEASRIWASLTPNHASSGYDLPLKVVSHQLTSSNIDITSLRSSAVHKQNMKRDIDLNYTNINPTGQEKFNRITGPVTFNRVNGEYPFPCKHNGIEPHQNLRGSLDLYSNETIPAMHLLSLMDAGMQSRTPFNVGVNAQIPKRTSYPSDCNTKLEIGASKTNGTLKRQPSDYYSRGYSSDKPHGCFIGSPTFGASSSTQHGKKFTRDAGSNGQNSTKFGKKEKNKNSNSPLQNRFVKQYSLSYCETETSLQRRPEILGTQTSVPLKITSGVSCMVNRNPADFTVPETGNVYMIRGEDLKFEKSVPKTKHRFPIPCGQKQQKNLKGTKMKEHTKH
ncbi:protein EMBRYONIC FLOWER 1 isoform X2 [Cicer arietinum]|nr:protein EMBRYONIC FLOWER 1 isoform X2 [Cicer arietinum]XP_012571669.1 protein EMBRYONIC FLOWER 1 isoform X2 [Cicer arietinum]